MRHLYLLRHTKSAWDSPGRDDKARILAPRGRKAGRDIGRWLKGLVPAPDHVLCSTAARARQTWEACAKAGDLDWPVTFRDDLYLASAENLLRVVRGLDDRVHAVMLVGHNPGLEDLARRLAGAGSEPEAMARLAEKYPTGGIAALVLERGHWRDFAAGGARLSLFETPRRLEAA